MGPAYVLDVGRQALEVMLTISLPLLGVALVMGLIVSVMQAVTQINETTLSFLPKLIGLAITLTVAGPWILSILTDYIRRVLESIPSAVVG
ncbi:MAG: flagellar biosynthesis protein FliQ [Gammaproteobacteria bacterium]|nr:flagellar biosynthesis protein FliQ [Gammaproteobacteria bacterium]